MSNRLQAKAGMVAAGVCQAPLPVDHRVVFASVNGHAMASVRVAFAIEPPQSFAVAAVNVRAAQE